jgi:hypothetical protein
MKKTKHLTDIFEKIQDEVNSVLKMHKSASEVWYRDRFSSEENSEDIEKKSHSEFADESVKNFI